MFQSCRAGRSRLSEGIYLCQSGRGRGLDGRDLQCQASSGVKFQRSNHDHTHGPLLRQRPLPSASPDVRRNRAHQVVVTMLHGIFVRVACWKLNLPLRTPTARFSRAGCGSPPRLRLSPDHRRRVVADSATPTQPVSPCYFARISIPQREGWDPGGQRSLGCAWTMTRGPRTATCALFAHQLGWGNCGSPSASCKVSRSPT